MGYPETWEADVVLKDGSTCHLRPIGPGDADSLRRFHSRLSEQTVYYRFFAPYPTLTDRDVARFTQVDHVDRVALVASLRGELVGVVRYERIDAGVAEVAFVVRDDYQGRGLGSVFLEHIAEAARERGIGRFVAEVLPDNVKMLEVFRQAGYASSSTVEDGVVSFAIDLAPTDSSRAVTQAREHRAEARSVQRLLTPRSVAVVGASRDPDSVGYALVRHLVEGGFTGRVVPVNREAHEIAGLPAAPTLAQAGQVDLVVVAVPAPGVLAVVDEAAEVGALGLVVVSAGFAESGAEGLRRQRELVERARASGMRVVGPNALGIISTDPDVMLNASLSPVMPGRGPIGFFSQSGAMGAALLEALVNRGLGLTTFFSAGNRADVSGNDLMQYWEEDDDTDVVLLYLESIGNPRKFSRIARRMARSKPIVAVKTGRFSQGAPLGHAVRATTVPQAAVDQLFAQSGVLRTDTLSEMFDVAQVLAFQPLPAGPQVLSIANSSAMSLMAGDALSGNALDSVAPAVLLGPDARATEYERALAAAMDDPAVDSVLVLFVPPLNDTGEEVARAVARVAGRATKPVVAVMFAVEGVHGLMRRLSADGVPQLGSVPTFAAVEDAVRAVGAVTRYAAWRRHATGGARDVGPVDHDGAERLVAQWLRAVAPDDHEGTVTLDDEQAADLLARFGIAVEPRRTVATEHDAVRAADALGYPVVVKTASTALRLRSDLGGIWFDLHDATDVRRAWAEAGRDQPVATDADLYVQRQATAGVSVTVSSAEDPLFGPVVCFGVAGIASDLLGDLAYRIPPLTDVDVDDLITGIKAAPLLLQPVTGPVDVDALRQLLHRVGQLAAGVPEVARLVLRPVVVGATGLTVLGARVVLARPVASTDGLARRLLS